MERIYQSAAFGGSVQRVPVPLDRQVIRAWPGVESDHGDVEFLRAQAWLVRLLVFLASAVQSLVIWSLQTRHSKVVHQTDS